MAFAATGTFTNPDDSDAEVIPNAYWVIESVVLTRGANPVDGLATFAVYRSLAAKNNGKKEKYRNTFRFNYAPAGGNVYSQAQTAMKALPWAPGLVDA